MKQAFTGLCEQAAEMDKHIQAAYEQSMAIYRKCEVMEQALKHIADEGWPDESLNAGEYANQILHEISDKAQ